MAPTMPWHASGIAVVATLGAALVSFGLSRGLSLSGYSCLLLFGFAIVYSAWRGGRFGGALSGLLTSVFVATTLGLSVGFGDIAVLTVSALALGLFAGWAIQIRPDGGHKLKENELKTVLDAAPAGILLTDHEGTILLSNTSVEAMFGYGDRELLGMAVEDLIPARYRAHHPGHRAAFYAKPEARSMGAGRELPGLRKDGTEFPVEIGLNPLTTPKGLQVLASVVDISARRTYENARRESEARTRQLADAMPQIVWTAGPSGQIDYYNRRWYDVTGLEVHGALDVDWRSIIHPDDANEAEELWGQSVASGLPFQHEFRIKTLATGYRWHLGRALPICDESGKVVRWYGTSTDIDDHKRVAEALEASEQRFRLLVESLPQLIWTCRADGYCDYLSRQWVSYTGIPEDAQLGYGWAEAVHPDDRARTMACWKQAVEQSKPYDLEFRIRNAAGEYRWFKTMAVRYSTEAGQFKWFGTNTDIDDIRRAQDAIRDINEQLERGVAARTADLTRLNEAMTLEIAQRGEAEARLQAVLDGATEIAIVSTDLDGAITLFNSGAERMLGYPADEIVGCETPALFHDADEVAARAAELSEQLDAPVTGFDVFVARARLGGHEEREWTFIRKDKKRLTVSLVVTAAYNERGAIAGFVGVAKDLTQARLAEAELRDSEERFRLLVEGVKDYAVYMLDPKGQVVSWNAGAERIKGYSADEILGRHFSVFYPPDVGLSVRLESILTRALTEGRYEESGWRVRKDGSRFWAHESISPLYHQDGSLRGYARLTRDASERRAAEEALATNEALLRQFIKHSPVAIAMFDTELRYLQASDRWRSDYHLSDTEIVGRSHYDIFPDLPERWKEIHRRVLGGVVEKCDDDRFERADGTLEWLQWECQPWYRAGGGVGGLILFTQVITERKQTEEQLREQEDRFRGAFDNAPIGIALVSPEGKWVRVNSSVCEMLGYTEEELLVTTFATLTHPEDLDADLANVQRTLSGEIQTYQMEKRYFRKDGELVHALLSVSLVRDARGEPLYFISQILDITQRKRYENELNASLREKELLLKEVHHRVKNNMQVVCTLLDLQTEFTDDGDVKSILRESQSRVRSMALIHERLYHTEDFARVDFSDYVERLAEGLYRAYRTSSDEVRLHVLVDSFPLPIDAAIPCGLLLNELISNCLKHAFPNGARGQIRVLLERDGDISALTVSDNGVGIPENLDVESTSSFGFQLVHTLVAQLRGEISCERGDGTAISIRFSTKE